MDKLTETILRILSIILVSYGSLSGELVGLAGGVFLFLLSYSNEIGKIKDRLGRLEERLNLKEDISKLRERVSIMEKKNKKGSKGQLTPTTTIIIILVVLFRTKC